MRLAGPRWMRRLAALLALLALCAVAAGCGGHQSNETSALDDAVGYFATDAPLVAALQTDPNDGQIKQVTKLVGRFPGSDILRVRLLELLRLGKLDWGRDVRPQLGAPLVAGLATPAAGRQAMTAALVLALRVKHPSQVRDTLRSNFHADGKSSGVRVYEDVRHSRYAALDGDVLVAASKRTTLDQALAVKRTGGRLRASGFERDLAQLPPGGLLRVSADPRALIGADPHLRPALSVKWLSSLRTLGAVVRASDSGLTVDLHTATDSGSVSNADLPLAPVKRALPLLGQANEVQMGVHEPRRLARFAVAVWRAIAPARATAFESREPVGIDLERQLPHHLGKVGLLAVNPIARTFALRAPLNQSGDVKTALPLLAPALPDLASELGVKGVGVATPEAGESFYALARPNAKTVVFGVVGDSLVAASQAERAARLASEPTHAAPGRPAGAAVVSVNARELAGELLAKRLNGAAALLAPLAVAALRDMTGTLAISRSGLDGHFKLTVVR